MEILPKGRGAGIPAGRYIYDCSHVYLCLGEQTTDGPQGPKVFAATLGHQGCLPPAHEAGAVANRLAIGRLPDVVTCAVPALDKPPGPALGPLAHEHDAIHFVVR